MSDGRLLNKEEIDLITAMVRWTPKECEIIESLAKCLVKDMSDGGMGSLLFLSADSRTRCFGKKIAEAEFDDEDGILVSVTINIDNYGLLFELDIWKVDFSQLKRYPLPNEIRRVHV